MTLTVEVAPEQETWLQQYATANGQPLDSLAGRLLAESIEDLQDIEEARRRLATDEGPNIPWEQVKAELNL